MVQALLLPAQEPAHWTRLPPSLVGILAFVALPGASAPKGPRGCSGFGFAFWSSKLVNTVDPGTAERPCFLMDIRSGCQIQPLTGGYDDTEVTGERSASGDHVALQQS